MLHNTWATWSVSYVRYENIKIEFFFNRFSVLNETALGNRSLERELWKKRQTICDSEIWRQWTEGRKVRLESGFVTNIPEFMNLRFKTSAIVDYLQEISQLLHKFFSRQENESFIFMFTFVTQNKHSRKQSY